ncbi:MBL fold metallo-hydrolase [Poseidonocella pacifica]|uniref:MBL fold metallo-hydrolase n=1 Tax=Poseidonocella pacifica TaxID=871651 RepID=UPI000AADE4C4|nr:MBL fold metallo-hydrolase [Poseidonocella pacifica]
MTDAANFDPKPGQVVTLREDLRLILAPNPSPMTFRGTNTYLLGSTELAVIDPGPDDPRHLDAILRSLQPGQKISHIFVTHAHRDHSALARPLATKTGAPILAFGPAHAGRTPLMKDLAKNTELGGGEGTDPTFQPDQTLRDGEVMQGENWRIEALWTPGHLSNHMSFSDGEALYCGDHVMGWSSSIVSPPDGDLGAFLASCARLRARPEPVFLPGHGPALTSPQARLDWLLNHRKSRERSILDALRKTPESTPHALAAEIYTETPRQLLPAAARNVLAHLIHLTERGLTSPKGNHGPTETYQLTGREEF